MAKIEEAITYKGHLCTFQKCIGNINYYTYIKNVGDDAAHLLCVNKSTKEILANISIETSGYEDSFNIDGYCIEKE